MWGLSTKDNLIHWWIKNIRTNKKTAICHQYLKFKAIKKDDLQTFKTCPFCRQYHERLKETLTHTKG